MITGLTFQGSGITWNEEFVLQKSTEIDSITPDRFMITFICI